MPSIQATAFHQGKHLSVAELCPSDLCPICGFNGKRPAYVKIQSSPDIDLLYCPKCEGLSASQMPTDAALENYYKDYYINSNHCVKSEKQITFSGPERLAKRILSHLKILPHDREYRIIDFGGGDGTISLLVAKRIFSETARKVHIQVVDYTTLPMHEEPGIKVEFLHNIQDAMGESDLVLGSAIFEHIPQLGDIITQVAGKMAQGGYMYVRTPYVSPFMRVLNVDMTFPGHVHDLGNAFWNKLPQWFNIPITIVHSSPSIVESGFAQNFIRTLAAYCFKFPSLWSRNPWWKFYGGWEIILKRDVVTSHELTQKSQ